jgi:ATP-dependent protease Clp ATPase subunit
LRIRKEKLKRSIVFMCTGEGLKVEELVEARQRSRPLAFGNSSKYQEESAEAQEEHNYHYISR